MKNISAIVLIFFLISCNEQDSCDLSSYPVAPFGNPDETLVGKNFIRYEYKCYNNLSYDKILTYNISNECWVLEIENIDNTNCP